MRGFIKIALAGIISFSSSAFAQDLAIDGKANIIISNVKISKDSLSVKYSSLKDFDGVGDPNIDCANQELIVVSESQNHNISSPILAEKYSNMAMYAHSMQTTATVEIRTLSGNECGIFSISVSAE